MSGLSIAEIVVVVLTIGFAAYIMFLLNLFNKD